jgi:hypothetical protein
MIEIPGGPMDQDQWYTKEELTKMVRQMQFTSNEFYTRAVQIGNHPFIEFAGFFNEYIKLCQEAIEAGVEFPRANAHSGTALPMKPHHAAYIGEKFDCIFGPSFRQNPELKRAFLEKLDGHAD